MLAIKVNKESMLRYLFLQGVQGFKDCLNFNQQTFLYTTKKLRIPEHIILLLMISIPTLL